MFRLLTGAAVLQNAGTAFPNLTLVLISVLFKSITNIRQSTCTAAAFREMLLDQSIDMDAPGWPVNLNNFVATTYVYFNQFGRGNEI